MSPILAAYSVGSATSDLGNVKVLVTPSEDMMQPSSPSFNSWPSLYHVTGWPSWDSLHMKVTASSFSTTCSGMDSETDGVSTTVASAVASASSISVVSNGCRGKFG